MNGKFILMIGVVVLLGCSAQKQGLRTFHIPMLQEADLLYVQEDYHGASVIYDRILEANPAHPLSNLRAGICRLNMRNHQTSALPFLERAKEQDVPEAVYYIGLALHFQERFDDALLSTKQYQHSGDNAIPSPEVNNSIAMISRAKEAYGQPKNHRLTNLGEAVNSPYPDYVPLINADGTELYFTSRRPGGVSDHHDPNGDYFEDIFVVRKEHGVWQEVLNIGAPINTASHDATVALSPSGNQLLIYRTNSSLEGGDIFLSQLTGKGWSDPDKFTDRVNSRFFEPSATIASDERTIYFSSNRPGGFGGKDLYRVVQLPDGNWSYPINLGPTINTSGNEDGPFITADGSTLYFSSTSHNSIGGYDIFKSSFDVQKQEWSAPESLGHPVNTVFDDIYLVLEANGRTGYYSTNRKGGFGDHDIYRVELGSENPVILVAGKTLDENQKPIRADFKVVQKNNEEVMLYQSNSRSGKYVLMLQPDQRYTVEISGVDCETIEVEFQYEEELGEPITNVQRDFVLKQLNQQSSNE